MKELPLAGGGANKAETDVGEALKVGEMLGLGLKVGETV